VVTHTLPAADPPARSAAGAGPDIDVQGLVKHYGALTAVDGVSFQVARGEVFGMLGPNGAGKTTTLEMVEGLRAPDAGTVRMFGIDVLANPGAVKERIGVQLQATALPEFTKVREAVELFAALYARARSPRQVIEDFSLTDKAEVYTSKLSGGQMQRLSVALALINDPDIVFLDEPTTGLDPQARLNIWGVIEDIRRRGKTVVLTTHYMEEAERLCDRVAVVDHGRIVAMDTPRRLIGEHASSTTIEFEPVPGLDAGRLAALPGADRVTSGERVSIATRNPEAVLHALLDPAAPWGAGAGPDAGAPLMRGLVVRQGTLEDVFIHLTGRSLRE
jgi:ABC-2 type transport system ATP-binding protein